MIISEKYTFFSPEVYLEAEKHSQIKHEYIQGQIYAMAGASDAHVTITLNVAFALRNHIRGSGCRVYANDMKARIESLNIFYYPDVLVTCDERDKSFDYFKRYPCLIVEVLVNTTEAFDRGDKFTDYSALESLKEYVIISQKRMRVECFRRNSEGQWVLYRYNEGEDVFLESINFHCPISHLYEDVSFTSASDSIQLMEELHSMSHL